MSGRFEVYQDRVGKWRFRLITSNGVRIADSGFYESKANAVAGCESVQRAAENAEVEYVDS